MPRLRSWTRKTGAEGRTEITAAAAQINLASDDDRKYLDAVTNTSRNVSSKAWSHHDNIGEIHYAVSRSARLAGYARLFAYQIEEDGTAGPEVNDGLAGDIVRGIYSPYGGTRGLIERYFALMKVPADSYLIRVSDTDGPDGYHFLSSHEIDGSSLDTMARDEFRGIRWITLPANTGATNRLVRDVPREDVLGRVWVPSARYVEMSDSPLFALETECDVLRTLTLSIKAKLKSRFAMAGLLFIPAEIQQAEISGLTNTGGQRVDDVLKYLISAMTRNVTNWDTAAALAPILLRGPGDAGEKIRHILLDREVFEADITLRAELVARILFGMDIQQQAVSGSKDANHWGAWAQGDDEKRVAVQPDLDNLAWALTRLVLHPQLEEAGMPPDQILKYRIGWDLAAASAKTNQQEDTRQAHDRGYASGKALMRSAGLDENDDELKGDEYVRWVGGKVRNARLMLWGLPEYDKIPWDDIEPEPSTPGPPPDADGTDPLVGPGVGDPGSPNNEKRSGRVPAPVQKAVPA
jgi:hypothetical protein